MNPVTDSCPWTESPFFETLIARKELLPEDEALVREFRDNGFVVLDDVLSDAECERIKDGVAGLYRPDQSEGARSRYRVQDAWPEVDAVRRLAVNERLMRFLRILYDRRPIPFQTLNFRHGTEQPAHSDTQHFSSRPGGFMCGVWVALEEMSADNGPLIYYPGSHQLPDLDLFGVDPADFGRLQREYIAHLDRTFERREFTARKGQALVWAARLWHGGSAIRREGATRHSQVTHYYFDECFYFAPQNSDTTIGRYCLKDLVDISTGEPVPQRYNGMALDVTAVGNGQSMLARAEVDPARVEAV